MKSSTSSTYKAVIALRSPCHDRLDSLLFDHLVELIAEALVLDFQSHPNITDSSPPRTDHKTPLTEDFAEG